MKTRFTTIIIICLAVCSLSLHAQIPGPPKVGTAAPEILFKNIYNYPKQEARLTDFKGKFIIIDFWATWCGPCVDAFEKLDKFQIKYQNKLQFMLVTDEPLSKVQNFYKKIALKDSNLPSATNGGNTRGMFAVVQIPHYIWIDDAGIIQAITGSEDVTAANLDLFLNKRPFKTVVKNDAAPFNLDIDIPLLADSNNLKRAEILNYSVLFRAKGTQSLVSYPIRAPYKGRRICVQTFSISGLYRVAYGHNKSWHVFPSNNVQVHMKDSLAYNYYSNLPDSLNVDNLYNYDLIIPQPDSAKLFSAMQRDLDEKFGLVVKFSKQIKKCLELRVVDEGKLVKSNATPFFKDTKISLSMKNQPIQKLVGLLNSHYQNRVFGQVFDETGLSFNIDLELNANLRNLEQLRIELRKNGLDLFEKDREVEIMILSKPDGA